MAYAPDSTAQMIQDRLRNLTGLVQRIEAARGHSERSLDYVIDAQDEHTRPENKSSSSSNRKLKLVYNKAIDDAKQEESLIRDALAKINEIRTIRNDRRFQARCAGAKETIRRGTLMKMLMDSAQTLPLYISKSGTERTPPLCGCMPAESSYVARMGAMVAAHVRNSDGEENWILAEVISFNEQTHRYEIDDVDEEEKQRHVVPKRRVIPLPLMRANPETDAQALFPKGSHVLALYPQTTCFYKAMVRMPPSTAQEEYEVLFQDAEYPEGYSPPLKVHQRYVIATKEGKKKIKANRD